MNRSGLSDGHFAMLILVVGRIVPAGHDSHRLSSSRREFSPAGVGFLGIITRLYLDIE